jgi:hypothetical protein
MEFIDARRQEGLRVAGHLIEAALAAVTWTNAAEPVAFERRATL